MKIVTAKELGQNLKLSESTIYKLAGNGEDPGFRLGMAGISRWKKCSNHQGGKG